MTTRTDVAPVQHRLLNRVQVAERLSMSDHTVLQYRKDGRKFFSDKAILMGGRICWKESDLNEFIESLEYELG